MIREWWQRNWETATLTICGLVVLLVMLTCLFVGFGDML